MIKDPKLYREMSERERQATLQEMTMEQSIAIAEALLTSELMAVAKFPDDDHPRSLAIQLKLKRRAAPDPTP
jgi:hypothetical protein